MKKMSKGLLKNLSLYKKILLPVVIVLFAIPLGVKAYSLACEYKLIREKRAAFDTLSGYIYSNLDYTFYYDEEVLSPFELKSDTILPENMSVFTSKEQARLLDDNVLYISSNTENAIALLENFADDEPEYSLSVIDEFSFDNVGSLSIYNFDYYSFREEYSKNKSNSILVGEIYADSFSVDDFTYYLGYDFSRIGSNLPLNTIGKRLETSLKVNPKLESVWLIMNPYDTDYSANTEDQKAVLSFIERNKDITFHILIHSPSLYVWNKETEEITRHISSYTALLEKLCEFSNVTIDSPGSYEWALINPGLFSDSSFDSETSKFISGKWIAHETPVDKDNMSDILLNLQDICKEYDNICNLDLSQKRVIFFGDSIIGNCHNITGIARLTHSFTGINESNQAVSGTTATNDFKDAVENYFVSNIENGAYYVIHYGFNDYSQIIPTTGEGSYANGLISGIEAIRKNDSEATIILVSPFYSSFRFSDSAISKMQDIKEYVNACQKVAADTNCHFINSYEELDINENNASEFLVDKVHLTEYGRLQYTIMLINHLKDWTID